MAKTRFTAQLLSGQFVSRTSTTMAYTHAVVCGNRAISWHTTHELAQRGLSQAARYYGFAPSAISVVKVTAEQIMPKGASEAHKNATRRGVITREIKRWQEYLVHTEATLSAWDAGVAAKEKIRLTGLFGQQRGMDLLAAVERQTRGAPVFARETIAKLEAERGALLAAKAEG